MVTSVGVGPIAQGKFTGSVGVSGSVGWSTLQTNTASMESTDGIGIQANALFADPFQYKYAVTPVILGGSPPSGVGDAFAPPKADIQAFGPLKTAFVVDPLAAGAGSWWTGDTSPYKRAPDVAVNHASRWILTKPGVGVLCQATAAITAAGHRMWIVPTLPLRRWKIPGIANTWQ